MKLTVGNKCDLSNEKQVTEEEKKLLKSKQEQILQKTSAKNSFKITEAMEMITKKLMTKSRQGPAGQSASNTEKTGVSLNDSKPKNK